MLPAHSWFFPPLYGSQSAVLAGVHYFSAQVKSKIDSKVDKVLGEWITILPTQETICAIFSKCICCKAFHQLSLQWYQTHSNPGPFLNWSCWRITDKPNYAQNLTKDGCFCHVLVLYCMCRYQNVTKWRLTFAIFTNACMQICKCVYA